MGRARVIIIALLVVLNWGRLTLAQDCFPSEAVDPWIGELEFGDRVSLPIVVDDLGYCVAGGRIVKLDLSDPRNPSVLDGQDPVAGEAKSLRVGGRWWILVTDEPAGVEIYDRLEAGDLVFQSRFEVPSWEYRQVVGVDEAVYVARSGDGFLIYDISDVTAPVLHQHVGPGEHYSLFGTVDDVLFTRHDAGLETYDLSDPLAPELTSHIGGVDPHIFLIAGTRAYGGYTFGGPIRAYDISDPRQPGVIGDSEASATQGYLTLIQGRLINSYWGGLRVFDISNDGIPRYLFNVDHVPDSLYGIADVGDAIYFAAYPGSYHVFDGAAPLSPQTSVLDGDFATRYMSGCGDHLYLFSDDVLSVYSYANPDQPVEASRTYIEDGRSPFAFHDGYAYSATVDNHMHVIDIHDPESPALVLTLSIGLTSQISSMTISYPFLYTVGEDYRLTIFDISDPEMPELRCSQWSTTSSAAVVNGRYVYIRKLDDPGMRILEVDDSGQPQLVAITDLDVSPMAGYGDLMVASTRLGPNTWGFCFMDISSPEQPTILSTLEAPLGPTAFDGRYLYWADFLDAAYVADLDDPTSPRFLGELAVTGGMMDVCLFDERVVWLGNWHKLTTTMKICDDGAVATEVVSFDVEVHANGHEIRWRLADPVDPGSLVLVCRQDAAEVAVSFVVDGARDYRGTHEPVKPLLPATYVLKESEGGFSRTLATKTVAASTAATRPRLELAPNPANPHVVIQLSLPEAGAWQAAVYDLRGRRAATLFDGERGPGAFQLEWSGRDDAGRELPSGTYLVRLRGDRSDVSRKVSLIR